MTIEDKLANRLFPEHLSALTWAQVVSAVQVADAAEKAQLVNALSQGQDRRVGALIQHIVSAYVRGLAMAEANSMMADDQLSRTELEKILT